MSVWNLKQAVHEKSWAITCVQNPIGARWAFLPTQLTIFHFDINLEIIIFSLKC